MPSKVDQDEEFLYEKHLYSVVERFLTEKKACDEVGSETSRPFSLNIFGGTIRPDVFGLKNSRSKNFTLYMAEGKNTFAGRNFDICKGQAITLQRFADYVYVFFPHASWKSITKEDKNAIKKECENLRLGLLLVSKSSCNEILEPVMSSLVLEERKVFAKDKICNFFPDFIGNEERSDYFEKYSEVAESIAVESYDLLDGLKQTFTNLMPQKKSAIRHDIEYGYELYLGSYMKKGVIFLSMFPFGDEYSENGVPTLRIQRRFKRSVITKKNNLETLSRHLESCIKKGTIVDLGGTSYYYNDDYTAKEVIDEFLTTDSPELSIIENIKICGINKDEIEKNVETKLKDGLTFFNKLS